MCFGCHRIINSNNEKYMDGMAVYVSSEQNRVQWLLRMRTLLCAVAL